MAYIAVIETGGKQYLVKPGDKIKVEKLDTEVGGEIVFEPLLVADETETEVKVGTPVVKGAKVMATVTAVGRTRKVEVVKYKPKVRYKRNNTHRQDYMEIKIVDIKI